MTVNSQPIFLKIPITGFSITTPRSAPVPIISISNTVVLPKFVLDLEDEGNLKSEKEMADVDWNVSKTDPDPRDWVTVGSLVKSGISTGIVYEITTDEGQDVLIYVWWSPRNRKHRHRLNRLSTDRLRAATRAGFAISLVSK